MVDYFLIPKKARNFLWGKPPSDPKEAKLLFKIDCFVLSYVCLNYWINFLDRSNVANAYVSGMQEDLNMTGIEYNVLNTMYTVGFIVGMIPSSLILLRIRPRYWLSFCGFAWGLITLGIYKVSTYKQLYVLRFFQAVFESNSFTGTHLLLGSWYNSQDTINPITSRIQTSELTKRSAVFTSAGLIGQIFSSLIQSAIYTNMDGRNGLAGWRWLFIIDFVITVPISIYGFIVFPDTPETCQAFYFTEEEIILAKNRVKRNDSDGKFDLSLLKRIFGRWHWYWFVLLFVWAGLNESFCTNTLFALWLKYYDYSVPDRNHFPMGVYAIGVFATFFGALYVYHTGGRYHWHVAIFIALSLIVSSIMILVKPQSTSVMFAAQYIAGISYACQATFLAWVNLVCKDDLQERAIVIASMNTVAYAVIAWWSILFFSTETIPKIRKPCYSMFATTVASAVVAVIIRILQVKEEKQNTYGKVKYDSENNEELFNGVQMHKTQERTTKEGSTKIEVKSQTKSE